MSKSAPDESKRRGQCLCGEIVFETDGSPIVVANCCCRDCQRWTGAGHSTGAMFLEKQVEVTGQTNAFVIDSESGFKVTRTFCPQCGSSLYGKNGKTPGVMTLQLGLFDLPESFQPQVTVFTRSQCPWDHIDPEIVSYETQPDWRPEI